MGLKTVFGDACAQSSHEWFEQPFRIKRGVVRNQSGGKQIRFFCGGGEYIPWRAEIQHIFANFLPL